MTMKKVLVVFDDVVLLSMFKRWASRSQEELLFFAKDGSKALKIIQDQRIDLLITALNLPDTEGIKLAVTAASDYPELGFSFFLPVGSSAKQKTLQKLSSFCFVAQPTSLKEFVQFANKIELQEIQFSFLHQVSRVDFLNLLASEQKTFLLSVDNAQTQQQALIYFEQGILYDAHCDALEAMQAIHEVLTWQQVRFSFQTLPVNKVFSRKIHASLAGILDAEADLKIASSVSVTNAVNTVAEKLLTTLVVTEKSDLITERVSQAVTEPVTVEQMVVVPKQPVKAMMQAKMLAEKIKPQDLLGLIDPLHKMSDYRAFVIFDMTGEVILQQHEQIAEQTAAKISPYFASLVSTTAAILAQAQLGKLCFIQISSESGVILMDWLIENQLIIAVLLKAGAEHSSLAKIRLDAICAAISTKINASL
jgi:CheY-like chemotaxis protein